MKPVALISGAGGSLGAALAVGLARDGFDIALHYSNDEAGALQTLETVCACGGAAEMFHANLAHESEAQELADTLNAHFGRLDVLVNNAGIRHERRGLDLTEAEWLEGLNSTVTQTFFATRAMLPLLRQSERKRVINIGEIGCDRPGARDLAWSYHIGKTGMWMLTRSFAVSEALYGVAVNMVSPGVLEDGTDTVPVTDIPAGYLGSPHDIHQAVRFLALEAPDYLTGTHLLLSGGWNLR